MKKIILILLLIGFVFSGLPVYGDVIEAPELELMDALNTIINILFWILLTIAAGFIILGAYHLMTAQGDPTKLEVGKNKILYAIIAVVVAMLARGIIIFIREQLGVD
jgi:uncharacterized protein involved in exopolysaccharide biosynthesis